MPYLKAILLLQTFATGSMLISLEVRDNHHNFHFESLDICMVNQINLSSKK